MRAVPCYEKKQRGCCYCTHVKVKAFKGDSHTACPFDVCPFHVLDKYKTYDEFMASKDSKILVNEFFTTIASIYELASERKPSRGFSDGDHRVDL